MVLEKLQNLELPASADMHVHLRDGATKNLVVPSIRDGGVNCVMVMVLPSFPPLSTDRSLYTSPTLSLLSRQSPMPSSTKQASKTLPPK